LYEAAEKAETNISNTPDLPDGVMTEPEHEIPTPKIPNSTKSIFVGVCFSERTQIDIKYTNTGAMEKITVAKLTGSVVKARM